MRRRLATIYVLMLGMVLAGLEVPLGVTFASRETQRMAQTRLSEAVRFAALAEPVLRQEDNTAILSELSAYYDAYGIHAAVVSREGETMVNAGDPAVLDDPEVASAINRAVNGEHVGTGGVIVPWRKTPLVVSAPVGSGADVLGAVVTISPVARERDTIRNAWLILATLGLIAVAVSMLIATALARWTLKPVAELDQAAHLITAGNYEARVAAHLGPPELRRLAAVFNEMADTVSDALERQRLFVSQASHQMRNPLTALRLRVEALGEEMVTSDGKTEHQLAMEETERLSRILDSLLALARAERGHYDVDTVDATRIAMGRVAAWQPLAQRRHVSLRYAASEVPVWVTTLSTALDQVLDALIDNALKFAGPGARVDVSVHPERGGVVVHVVDDGPGLSEEQRQRATERFWRAPDAQNMDGSGLGLPIVAVLVEASGGQLDLLPAAPRGLDVRLWLPAARRP
ncbi:MAG TPA: HAMP domain-containing sensor histidine kinase [Micromonosporaceae bacterium]|nr:HAMP domain-containing sensor histidine kinase [Micromonosporaceae bacterium]